MTIKTLVSRGASNAAVARLLGVTYRQGNSANTAQTRKSTVALSRKTICRLTCVHFPYASCSSAYPSALSDPG